MLQLSCNHIDIYRVLAIYFSHCSKIDLAVVTFQGESHGPLTCGFACNCPEPEAWATEASGHTYTHNMYVYIFFLHCNVILASCFFHCLYMYMYDTHTHTYIRMTHVYIYAHFIYLYIFAKYNITCTPAISWKPPTITDVNTICLLLPVTPETVATYYEIASPDAVACSVPELT